MTISDLQSLVGFSDIKVKSTSFRFSELHALAKKAGSMERGKLTIVVCEGTLNTAELRSLSEAGGAFVALDLTEI